MSGPGVSRLRGPHPPTVTAPAAPAEPTPLVAPHESVHPPPDVAASGVDSATSTRRERDARAVVGADAAPTAPTGAPAPEGSMPAGSLPSGDDLARRRAGAGALPAAAGRVDDHLPEEAVSRVTPERRMDRVDLPASDATLPLSERIVSAAEANVGYDSRTNGGDRCRGGRGACAWAVNQIVTAAGSDPIVGNRAHPGAGLAPTHERLDAMVRDGRAERVEVGPDTTHLPPGAIICSADPRGVGHIGIVGRDGTHIYSNASRDGMWEQNYDSPAAWHHTFTAEDGARHVGPTYAYVLHDPAAETAAPAN